MIQEGVRAYYMGGWYEDVVTTLPAVAGGFVSAPDGAGLGTRLRTEFVERPDVLTRVTEDISRSSVLAGPAR
jgi:L-alanine-DL-glutamate epimerase-like enolase superfamily enzyme